ncbi:Hypothetical protein FKW44_014029 [Caligus rogercresseyi]|uniref:Retrotransposon gag domain-containing protein n=1 Tax=Caligus rogercresseyi TaxID=217165 RepID=A0A7T8GXW1_CALRO|nr:Hypothetical protein FKW44_020486 [Caligus rogercresseyi]QQP40095.1 Hypothetical protein FKW44_014029 [Caligus rogercresseyi]
MDGDTIYRAQNVLSDFKKTLRGQSPVDPINTIDDFLDRMDCVINKVGEKDRAKLRLDTLKQRPYETTADYFQECCNLWDIEEKKKNDSTNHELMKNFDELLQRELQALKFRNLQADEPMDVDAMTAASRRRSYRLRQFVVYPSGKLELLQIK